MSEKNLWNLIVLRFLLFWLCRNGCWVFEHCAEKVNNKFFVLFKLLPIQKRNTYWQVVQIGLNLQKTKRGLNHFSMLVIGKSK